MTEPELRAFYEAVLAELGGCESQAERGLHPVALLRRRETDRKAQRWAIQSARLTLAEALQIDGPRLSRTQLQELVLRAFQRLREAHRVD